MSAMKRTAGRLARLFYRLQYRQKLLVAILLLTLSPLLLLSAVYMSTYTKGKLDAILEQESRAFAAEAENLDDKYYSGIKKSVYLANNLQVVEMLKEDYRDDLLSYMNNLGNVQSVLEALRSDELQSRIVVYGFNPTIYRTEGIAKIEDLDLATRSRVLDGDEEYPVRTFLVSPENGRLEAHIYSKIMDLSKTLAITEVVFPLDQSITKLRSLLPSDSFMMYRAKDGTSFAIGANGVSAADMPSAGESMPPRPDDYYRVEIHLKSAQDDLLLYVDKTAVRLRLGGLMAIPVVMLIGLLLTILFSIRFVTTLLTRRLAALMKSIRSETDTLERFSAGPPEAGNDELGQLEGTFRGLVLQIRDYYRRSAENELERRLLEAELLQGNINPHVLYNTLSAIRWIYPDDKLQTLVDDMVDFYRLFLNRGEIAAPLSQEFEMIRKFMEIHKFTYESDFTYVLELADDTEKAYILRNMLQPIVENALLHGVNSLTEGGGEVTLAARREGALLVIEVADNGRGMEDWQRTADRLDAAAGESRPADSGQWERPTAGARPTGSGYALANIRRRIKLYYGDEYDIRFEAVPGGGTRVILRVPFRTGA